MRCLIDASMIESRYIQSHYGKTTGNEASIAAAVPSSLAPVDNADVSHMNSAELRSFLTLGWAIRCDESVITKY